MKKAFILGNPRSGTSLFRLMLNTHPFIACPPESGFLEWWYEKYKNWSLDDSHSIASIKEYVQDLLSSRKIETWNINEGEIIDYIAEKKPVNYTTLGESIYLFQALKQDKKPSIIADKNNYYIHHLAKLNEIWSDAYYIFIIRDGRDVACSYLDIAKLDTSSPYKPVLSQNVEDIAKEWNENNLKINDFLKTLDNERSIFIRYEDLVADPKLILEQVCSFLGVAFSERMLEYVDFNDEPIQTLDWKKKTLSAPDPSNIGKYAKQLDSENISLFNTIAKESLELGRYPSV